MKFAALNTFLAFYLMADLAEASIRAQRRRAHEETREASLIGQPGLVETRSVDEKKHRSKVTNPWESRDETLPVDSKEIPPPVLETKEIPPPHRPRAKTHNHHVETRSKDRREGHDDIEPKEIPPPALETKEIPPPRPRAKTRKHHVETRSEDKREGDDEIESRSDWWFGRLWMSDMKSPPCSSSGAGNTVEYCILQYNGFNAEQCQGTYWQSACCFCNSVNNWQPKSFHIRDKVQHYDMIPLQTDQHKGVFHGPTNLQQPNQQWVLIPSTLWQVRGGFRICDKYYKRCLWNPLDSSSYYPRKRHVEHVDSIQNVHITNEISGYWSITQATSDKLYYYIKGAQTGAICKDSSGNQLMVDKDYANRQECMWRFDYWAGDGPLPDFLANRGF